MNYFLMGTDRELLQIVKMCQLSQSLEIDTKFWKLWVIGKNNIVVVDVR